MNIDERARRAGTKLREHADGLDADVLYERVTVESGPGRRARSRLRAVAVGTVVVALLAGLAVIVYPMIVGSDTTAPFVEPSGPAGSDPPADDPADVPHGRFDAADARGRTTLVALDAIPEGVTPGFAAGLPAFYVRDGDDVEVIVDDPQHLDGEALWWCTDEDVFLSPSHGELFTREGRALLGPAARNLDTLDARTLGDGFLAVSGRDFESGTRAEVDGWSSAREVLGEEALDAYRRGTRPFCEAHVPAEARSDSIAGTAPLPVPDGVVERLAPWGLRAPVDTGTSSLEIEVYGGACGSEVESAMSHVVVHETDTEVVVEAAHRWRAASSREGDDGEGGGWLCRGIGMMHPVTVPLSSPLGDRELVDPACADIDRHGSGPYVPHVLAPYVVACPVDKRDTAPR